MALDPLALAEKARSVTLLVLDCDGVLTDGRLYYGVSGEELKVFDVRDGLGLVRWHSVGGITAIISGRNSPIVKTRFEPLGVSRILQGNEDKEPLFSRLVEDLDLSWEQVAYMGDDLPDLAPMRLAGLSAAPKDARPEVLEKADYVANVGGGRGAVRELIELLLASRDAT
ncbi:MAG: KdsC family phosphatase [Pyrinomonadaceae bacterium]